MFKKLFASAVIGAALIGTQAASAADFTLKFGHLASDQHIWNKSAMKFKELVEENSEGRIEVQVFPNGQLGNEMALINSIQLGTADMTITGESLQNWAPKAAMMAVPYLFRDSEHLRETVTSEIGDEIEAQITEATGLVPIAWFERGPRQLTSNRPIQTPDELNNLSLRVPNVPLFVDTWQALGAKPVPMAFSEVFSALQQGTIDAQENPLALIESASFSEVQDYVNVTDHVRSWIYVVIGQNKLQSMPEELQQVVLDAAKEMQAYHAKLFKEEQKRLKQTLQEEGMEFIEVDQQAFAEQATPAVLESLTEEQKAIYEAIQDL
nr:TRAP transporter substrate-binding protein [uncultured Halomonas sp.]